MSEDIEQSIFNAAMILREQGLLEQAAEKFLELAKLNTKSAVGYAMAGNIYLEQGFYERALPLFEKSVIMTPQSVSSSTSLLLTHHGLGDFRAVLKEAHRYRMVYLDSNLVCRLNGERKIEAREHFDFVTSLVEKQWNDELVEEFLASDI